MSDALNPFAPPAAVLEAPPSLSVDPQRLGGVETGLRLAYYGIVLILLCVIGMVAAMTILPAAVLVLSGGMFIGWVLIVIGPFFCLTVPTETNAKGLIVGSVFCQALALIISVLATVLPVARLVGSTGTLFALAGHVLFLLFLMRIARHVNRPDLHRRGFNILVGACVVFVISMATVVGIIMVGPAAGVLMFANAIGFLVLFVMYANLLNSLYKAIAVLRR